LDAKTHGQFGMDAPESIGLRETAQNCQVPKFFGGKACASREFALINFAWRTQPSRQEWLTPTWAATTLPTPTIGED